MEMADGNIGLEIDLGNLEDEEDNRNEKNGNAICGNKEES